MSLRDVSAKVHGLFPSTRLKRICHTGAEAAAPSWPATGSAGLEGSHSRRLPACSASRSSHSSCTHDSCQTSVAWASQASRVPLESGPCPCLPRDWGGATLHACSSAHTRQVGWLVAGPDTPGPGIAGVRGLLIWPNSQQMQPLQPVSQSSHVGALHARSLVAVPCCAALQLHCA